MINNKKVKKRYFQLNYIRKVVENKKPGLVAVNLINGFKDAIIIFKYDGKYYKTTNQLSFYLEADGNISIDCEEVVLSVKDYLFERVKK